MRGYVLGKLRSLDRCLQREGEVFISIDSNLASEEVKFQEFYDFEYLCNKIILTAQSMVITYIQRSCELPTY